MLPIYSDYPLKFSQLTLFNPLTAGGNKRTYLRKPSTQAWRLV